MCADADAGAFFGTEIVDFGYSHEEVGLELFVWQVVSEVQAAGDVEVNLCVGDICCVECLEDFSADGVDLDAFDGCFGDASLESFEVVFEGEGLVVVCADYFVNAVSEKGSAIGVSRFELVERDDFVLYHCQLHMVSSEI